MQDSVICVASLRSVSSQVAPAILQGHFTENKGKIKQIMMTRSQNGTYLSLRIECSLIY
jgi:hypothetical protein